MVCIGSAICLLLMHHALFVIICALYSFQLMGPAGEDTCYARGFAVLSSRPVAGMVQLNHPWICQSAQRFS